MRRDDVHLGAPLRQLRGKHIGHIVKNHDRPIEVSTFENVIGGQCRTLETINGLPAVAPDAIPPPGCTGREYDIVRLELGNRPGIMRAAGVKIDITHLPQLIEPMVRNPPPGRQPAKTGLTDNPSAHFVAPIGDDDVMPGPRQNQRRCYHVNGPEVAGALN